MAVERSGERWAKGEAWSTLGGGGRTARSRGSRGDHGSLPHYGVSARQGSGSNTPGQSAGDSILQETAAAEQRARVKFPSTIVWWQ
jgi:hypothetical protein